LGRPSPPGRQSPRPVCFARSCGTRTRQGSQRICASICAASPLGDPGGQPGDHGGPVAGSGWVAGPPQRARVLPNGRPLRGPWRRRLGWTGRRRWRVDTRGATRPGSRSPGRWGEDAVWTGRRARQEARVDRPGVSQLPSPGGGSSEVGGAGRERGLGDHGRSDGGPRSSETMLGRRSARLPFASWHLALASASQRAMCPSHRASSAPLVATTSRLWLQARQHRQARSLATSPQKGSELVSVA